MVENENLSFFHSVAADFNVYSESLIHQYIERKTKASDRDSKARRSLGNLYALYVLCNDFVSGNQNGSSFTELMGNMKSMPFGAKLQNHPLDNRLNDEFQRQYNCPVEMLPVQPALAVNGKKARKISMALLSEGGMNPLDTAKFVVVSIEMYIGIINDNQTAYLNEIEATKTDLEVINLISKGFEYNSDARLFEIISFALLHLHYRKTQVVITIDGVESTQSLCLYRTGRTNANDGGIDFVLSPLGKFFQVTETLDFKKYFLDFDKINKFPMSFVIKTELSDQEVREQIRKNASTELEAPVVDTYINLFDDIFTINELTNILKWVSSSHELTLELKNIVITCFKLEYGLLD